MVNIDLFKKTTPNILATTRKLPLNPIELVWHELKHFLIGQHKPDTLDELKSGIQTFWSTRMTPQKCQRYVVHIQKVLPKVVECGGRPTGY